MKAIKNMLKFTALHQYLKFFILPFCALLPFLSAGQSPSMPFTYRAVLMDSLNKQPLPFASIYKTRDRKGTLSKLNGEMELENVQWGDTIVCTYIGFERKLIILEKAYSDTLFLHREAQLMDEVTILADNSILYELIHAASKSKNHATRIGKTYFELESFQDTQQLELFQGYYNGSYNGYDVVALDMKNGRFTLSPIDKRLFASTETSKAMYLQTTLGKNTYFPISPFELSRNKLKQDYTLQLFSKYKNDEQNTVYEIGFVPKKQSNEYFEGKVWIDSLCGQILKVHLTIRDAKTHPFQPIWSIHHLKGVDLDISKTYEAIDGAMYVKSIDFNYRISYISEEDSILEVRTRALLYAYNYDEQFVVPFFHFSDGSDRDYRTIQMLPYNESFWRCTDEFKIQVNDAVKNAFIENTANISSNQVLSSDTIFDKNFFENPYVTWSPNRILFRENSADSANYTLAQGTIPALRYHLEVQLFMDINELCDSTQIITKTIFDPYLSYYKFPTSKESQVFINIYFDLIEIERRKLAEALTKCGNDTKQMQREYTKAIESAEKISEIYFKEVQRGTNKELLIKWNSLVLEQLGIDTMALFGLK